MDSEMFYAVRYGVHRTLRELENPLSFPRWILTIVAFPLGGFLAIQVASTADGPGWAALAGLIAGAVIGTAQWLALRPRVSALWIPATAAAMAVGLALATLITGGATTLGALALSGAIAGAVVGAAQAIVLRKWTWILTMALSWSAGWAISSLVIIDEQRGFATFGLSGAALVTVVTGVALRALFGRRAARPEAATA
jgi:hypothetical protein